MALPKKKSRILTIDNNQYRWLVSPSNEYNILVVEAENVKGQKIEVYFETDINNYWLEFPKVEHLNLKVIKPKDVSLIIKKALKIGWNPYEKGVTLSFELQNYNELVKRN